MRMVNRLALWAVMLPAALAWTACGPPDHDHDGSPATVDCDDDDPLTYRGAPELCDEKDNNCNGEIDEQAVDAPTWYFDRDNDTFGDDNLTEVGCTPRGTGWVAQGGDCDDLQATAHPGGTETCDGADNDCDGAVDEDAPDAEPWYADADHDGFGDPDEELRACFEPPGFVRDRSDCDDSDFNQKPGADELCNDEDDDCDGAVDEDVVDGVIVYEDADGDDLGDPESARGVCEIPSGVVENGLDCDDSDDQIKAGCTCSDGSEGALEIVDGETVVLKSGVHHFTNVHVPRNATLRFRGEEPVWLYANTVNIEGLIDVSGMDGVASVPGTAGDGGDAGPGGGGGGGGGDCSNGAGDGGFPNGQDATGSRGRDGGDGGLGYAISATPSQGGSQAYYQGGGGGGHGATGANGSAANASGGYGGAAYGVADLSTSFAGGGGGAGGATDGGGGGGGGGAIQIVAAEIILSGDVESDGGRGAINNGGSCTSGGGGGGAGGAIWLTADRLSLTGSLSAEGGRGGNGGTTYNGGGVGADGRIRVSAPELELSARFVSPSPSTAFDAPSCPRPE